MFESIKKYNERLKTKRVDLVELILTVLMVFGLGLFVLPQSVTPIVAENPFLSAFIVVSFVSGALEIIRDAFYAILYFFKKS